MNTTFYRCCFYSKPIQSSNGDPCEIDILINIDKPKNKQYNQIFYCHMECFKEKLHEKIRIYFALKYLIPSDND